MRVALAAPVLSLMTAGCMLLDGRCIYELRSLQAAGDVQIGTESVSARVTLSEQRDSDPNKSFYWALLGPTLKTHVLAASFRDASAPSTVLLQLPLSTSAQPTIAEGEVSDRNGTNLNGYFDIIAAGRGVIVIETDFSSMPTITIAMVVTQKQDWTRPYCS